MKIAKLISGIIALLGGLLLLWGTAIGAVFVLGLNQGGVSFVLIGLVAAVGMMTSGILQIVARKSYRPKLELWAVGLMLVLFVLSLIVHKTYVDLWAQVGVPLLFAAILFGAEYNGSRTKLA